jgi:hypothetical protein
MTAKDQNGWAGRQVARSVAETHSRQRLDTTGTILKNQIVTRAGVACYLCVLDDGTGEVDLLFLGRRGVPALAAGARCHVEGTARLEGGRLTIWNPAYYLEL